MSYRKSKQAARKPVIEKKEKTLAEKIRFWLNSLSVAHWSIYLIAVTLVAAVLIGIQLFSFHGTAPGFYDYVLFTLFFLPLALMGLLWFYRREKWTPGAGLSRGTGARLQGLIVMALSLIVGLYFIFFGIQQFFAP